jgi:hypothetical protein
LLNVTARQQVFDAPGATTDPVEKPMEKSLVADVVRWRRRSES